MKKVRQTKERSAGWAWPGGHYSPVAQVKVSHGCSNDPTCPVPLNPSPSFHPVPGKPPTSLFFPPLYLASPVPSSPCVTSSSFLEALECIQISLCSGWGMRRVWVRISLWQRSCCVTTDHIPHSSQMACGNKLLVTRGQRQEILKETVQTHYHS